jgi:hypothetical protein
VKRLAVLALLVNCAAGCATKTFPPSVVDEALRDALGSEIEYLFDHPLRGAFANLHLTRAVQLGVSFALG